MTAPHLDDEQLSLLLDGLEVDGRAHLADDACAACNARLDALRSARDAVASAAVPPLPADVLDRLVASALDAPVEVGADVVPIAAARRRRLSTPPPAWLLGAAAAIALLAGVAGLVQSGRSGGDGGSMALTKRVPSSEESSGAGGAVAADSSAVAEGTTAAAPLDPELVVADLADQDDPGELALTLDGLTGSLTSQFSARATSGGAAPAGEDATTDAPAAASPPSPTSTAPADRARCRAEADAIGGGSFAALLSTATLRWQGQPAEVLVYRLAEPSADRAVTRQALVLSRPGCSLLADPRF